LCPPEERRVNTLGNKAEKFSSGAEARLKVADLRWG